MPADNSREGDHTLKQANVRYPQRDLDAAADAAKWEGLTLTDFFRSALKARIRETQAKRAEYERRVAGDQPPDKT